MKKILMVFVAYVFIYLCWLLLNNAAYYYLLNRLVEIGDVAVRILLGQTKGPIGLKSWIVWLFIFSVLYYFVSFKSRNKGLPVEIKLVATIDLAIGCIAAALALFCIIELQVIISHDLPASYGSYGSMALLGLIPVIPRLIVSSILAFLSITTWKRISILDSKIRGPIFTIYLFFGLLLVFATITKVMFND